MIKRCIVFTYLLSTINGFTSCQYLFEQAAINYELSALVSLKQSSKCQLEADTAIWITLTEKEDLFRLTDYQNFVKTHAGWPLKKIIKNAEKTFKKAQLAELISWTKLYTPQTSEGIFVFLQAMAQLDRKTLAKKVKAIWANTPLTDDQERQFLHLYGNLLNNDDHYQRAQTMINNKNIAVAKRQLQYLDEDKRRVMATRLALLENNPDAEQLYFDLPELYQHNPIILLNYIQWLVKHKDDKVYTLILNQSTLHTLNPQDLWKVIHTLIRRAFENNDWNLALELAEHHPVKKGADYFDAEWLRGWLLYHSGKQQQRAQDIFKNLYATMQTPICRAKSAYWTARLYENKNKTEARQWYLKAAHYPMTFYGQQAARLLNHSLVLKPAVLPDRNTQKKFNERQFVKIIKLLKKHPQFKSYVRKFLSHLLMTVPVDEKILVAKLAVQVDPEFSVAAAKDAASHTPGFVPEAYKILPPSLVKQMQTVEPALIHAIIRKESTFNSEIVSSTGALGMMQVMPKTGQMLTKQLKIPFSLDQLRQTDYNIKLGSEYVRQQLKNFEGSIVLMLAAYNAGPRPVKRWIEAFGDPRSPQIDFIDWIEKIPYGETRNYVHRVMENYFVYKTLLKK